ncbi:alpha/beta hydrolase [Alphaproteobacteria bacterium]|jgi:3-oxoadipate enol-lactonase|nr:alpha/beta hydrolase [Alphaproteobacteria bacterium]
MYSLDLVDGKLIYDVTGVSGGDTVLFCHSLGANRSLWNRQMGLLAKTHRIVSLDLRGHGQSDIFTTPYSIELLAKDVLRLLDKLEIGTCSFVGLSLGSMIGLWLAAHAPQRFDKMVLAGASAAVQNSAPFNHRISLVQQHGLASMFDELAVRWYAPGFAAKEPMIVSAVRDMVLKTPLEGYVAATMAVRDFDIVDKLPDISTPLLLITGCQDKATPLDEAEFIAKKCANATLHVIDDASHLAMVEKPDEFDSALVAFINDNAKVM